LSDQGLSAIRAAATAVGGFSLFAVLVYVADEYPAAYAGMGTQALQTGVVRLYSVVVILGGWVRVGCARLSSVHSEPPSSVGQVPGCCYTRGAIPLSDTHILPIYYTFTTLLWYNFRKRS
jgi:hypothetical protein